MNSDNEEFMLPRNSNILYDYLDEDDEQILLRHSNHYIKNIDKQG
jgi:hypothetical protein